MHMADALISPAVGGTMWLVAAGLIGWCARKIKLTLDGRLVPLMGVLGAFVFASQMINFSIPFTGSSGHLGGGLILAILLGPYAAFVVIASVLTVQALFFADGGLLALGCNVFNLGFFPAFVAYPLVFKPIARGAVGGVRLWLAAMLAAIAGLQMGAFGVVLETMMSGVADLPFATFVLLMQSIHLAIGMAEGAATAVVVSFVMRARPVAVYEHAATAPGTGGLSRVVLVLLITALAMGGGLSWFASTHPDGLEWAIQRVVGKTSGIRSESGVHQKALAMQQKTAILPDYNFKTAEAKATEAASSAEESATWPAANVGKSVSGLVGGLVTFALAGLVGYSLKRRSVRVARGR